jgi:hypothetical protein
MLIRYGFTNENLDSTFVGSEDFLGSLVEEVHIQQDGRLF